MNVCLIRVVERPTELSVSLDDFKLYLRHEESVGNTEDSMLTSMIQEAESWVGSRQWRTIMPTTFEALIPGWEWPLEFALPNLLSVESIEYRDESGDWQTFDSANYETVTAATPGLALLSPGVALPQLYDTEQSVRVTWIAGYADAAAVPEHTRAAVRAMARWLYDHRDGMEPPEGICHLADADAVRHFVSTTSR